MKKRVASFLFALIMIIGVCIPAGATESKKALRFDENGEFKIMHLTDCQDIYPANETMLKFIDASLKEYQPDLVVLGGDNVVADSENLEAGIAELVKVFADNKTYFTLVFGNHDCERGMTNDELLVLYQKYGGEYCLADDLYPELHGCGTQMLPVLSSKSDDTALALYMFDSGSKAYDEDGNKVGYDCVHKDQIEWYKETSLTLEKQEGKKVPAFAFQHIVVGEVYDALFFESAVDMGELTRKFNGKIYSFFPKTNNFSGFLLEYPCPGYYNFGQFEAMVERGDVVAMFSGHDHVNTYETEIDGVKIISTGGATYHSYGNDKTRGFRLITVNENDVKGFESETITVNDFALANDDFANVAGISSISAIGSEILAAVMLAFGKFSGIFAGIIDFVF